VVLQLSRLVHSEGLRAVFRSGRNVWVVWAARWERWKVGDLSWECNFLPLVVIRHYSNAKSLVITNGKKSPI